MSKNEKIIIFSFHCMCDQSRRSLISYLEPISSPTCICILKLRSTEMQYVMYLPTLLYYSFSQCTPYVNIFYYSFSQCTTYVNILKWNEIPIFSFSIARKYTNFLGLHFLPQCTYFAKTGWYWNVYVISIHTLDTELRDAKCLWIHRNLPIKM